MPGLCYKTWQMVDGGFYAGVYIWATEKARADFLESFRASPSRVTQIVGHDPDVIIDIATLTGAMPVALGRRTAGVFCNDDELAAQLLAAAEASGERAWRMPLVEDYRVALDSPTADLRNIGQPNLKLGGGSITAALFLREFAGGRPWAHFDIAGPGRAESDDDELTKGGTGYGVRLLTRWLEELAAGGKRKAA
jgi:leucyl aminopeptidase